MVQRVQTQWGNRTDLGKIREGEFDIVRCPKCKFNIHNSTLRTVVPNIWGGTYIYYFYSTQKYSSSNQPFGNANYRMCSSN